jgi:undecaprenyl pyrophosphate phosphatase UppP
MKARVISKVIVLWFKGNISGANQLAACEGLAEFLPISETDSANCMEQILLGCL